MRYPMPTIAFAILACSLVLTLAACSEGGGDDPPTGGSGGGGDGGTGGTGGSGGTGGDGGTGGTGGDGGDGGDGGCGTGFEIHSLEPNEGPIGETVKIIGCNFKLPIEASFNETTTAVQSVANDGKSLLTAVPNGATTGTVRLLVGPDRVRVDGPLFTVLKIDPKPEITSISPSATTEARPGQEKTVSFTMGGGGFISQSRVYLQERFNGEQRLLQEECTNSSPTAMKCTLGGDLFSTPKTLRFQVKNEREGFTGGGASNIGLFYVVSHVDLVTALALGERRVGLAFSTGVAEWGLSASFAPALDIDSTTRDENDPRIVYVELKEGTAMKPDVTYAVVAEAVSELGGEIWDAGASFRGFNSKPVLSEEPMGAQGVGCTASTFHGPGAVSVAGGQVFVTEYAGQQIQVLNLDNTVVGFLGHDGDSAGLHTGEAAAAGCPEGGSDAAGAFRNPRGKVAVDPDSGDRIVADTGNARMLRFAADGTYKGPFGSGFTEPVIVAQIGKDVWVADADDKIRVISVSGSGNVAHGGTGTADGQFSFGIAGGATPAAVSDGTFVYVAEPGNHRVQKFRRSGMEPMGWAGVNHVSFQTGGTCCEAGTGDVQFTNIRGLAMDLAGFLYVADEGDEGVGSRIQKLARDGQHVMTLTLDFVPSGIEIDQNNILWVTDAVSNQLRKYQL